MTTLLSAASEVGYKQRLHWPHQLVNKQNKPVESPATRYGFSPTLLSGSIVASPSDPLQVTTTWTSKSLILLLLLKPLITTMIAFKRKTTAPSSKARSVVYESEVPQGKVAKPIPGMVRVQRPRPPR